MPPSNNVITSFLSTLIGQPHFGAEGPRNASIVTRRTFPYVGGAAGHETSRTSSESHPRAQETKMAAGEKVRAESDAADPGYSAAGRACQTERFARFCLRIDFARGCCYMD